MADAKADANSRADANPDDFASAATSHFHEEYSLADANDMADANLQLCSGWRNDHLMDQ